MASKTYSSFSSTYRTNLNDATIRDLLYTYGPLVVLIDATPLQSYTGGIMNSACSGVNHAVNLVGYATTGTGAPYYILRNSWGTNWGEVSKFTKTIFILATIPKLQLIGLSFFIFILKSGYFRVSAANSCLIKKYVWYASY